MMAISQSFVWLLFNTYLLQVKAQAAADAKQTGDGTELL